jgi:acyl-coenzyme A thioesterase 13
MTLSEKLRARIAAWTSDGIWDAGLAGTELVDAGEGRARIRLPVTRAVQNFGGAMHGGAIATLVDVLGTVAIMTADRHHRPGVTTDLNVSYFSPGKGVVVADAQVLKCGRTLAFVTVDVRREDDGALVAQGRMTKAMGPEPTGG